SLVSLLSVAAGWREEVGHVLARAHGPAGGALLEERADSLRGVGLAAGPPEGARVEVVGAGEVRLALHPPEEPLRDRDRDGRRVAGDLARQRPRRREELRIGDHAAHETELEGVTGAQQATGHEQLGGARHPDQTRKDPRAERLRNDAAAHEDEADLRAL